MVAIRKKISYAFVRHCRFLSCICYAPNFPSAGEECQDFLITNIPMGSNLHVLSHVTHLSLPAIEVRCARGTVRSRRDARPLFRREKGRRESKAIAPQAIADALAERAQRSVRGRRYSLAKVPYALSAYP